MGKRRGGSETTSRAMAEPEKKRRKSSPVDGLNSVTKNMRSSNSTNERLPYDDYFKREKYKAFASDDSLTLDMISKLLEASLEPEIRSSKQEVGPAKKLRWCLLNFHSVVRAIVREFLPHKDYTTWNDDYTKKTVHTRVFRAFYRMFELEKIDPLPTYWGGRKSKFAQLVVGPWVDRLLRVQKTLTGDLVAFLLCKIYEHKESKNDFSVLGDIKNRYDFFIGELGQRLPVLYKKLEIPQELLDAEEPATESANVTEVESEDASENELIQACFKRCRNEICSSALPVLQKIDHAKEMAEDHKLKQEKWEKKARCEAGCAELLQKYAAEMAAEEERRIMYQQMKQEVDTNEDVMKMRTRAEFYVQVVTVILSSMSAAEQEAVLNGEMEIPWDDYEIEFEDEDKDGQIERMEETS